jgi:transposase InsO family protein
MLADTSLPHGSDVSLSTVGSLSQELSHRRITLTACPGRIPLVEQRVLSQLTLLKQPVKRLSCRADITRLQAVGTQISMAEVGAAWQNGYAERLMRTIKEEEVELSDYQNYADVMRHIGRFLDEVYMHKRIHSSLGYLTPAEFESQWRQQQSGQPAMN